MDRETLEKELQEHRKMMEEAMFTSDRFAAYTNWHRQHAIVGYIISKLNELEKAKQEAVGGDNKEE